MSDASQTTRAPTILRCTTSPQGLSVRQIVRHVVSTQPCGSPGCTIDRLVDIADACVRLGAQRQVLTAGLATQEALDRLVQIAAGRETARRLAADERVAVVALQSDMRTRLNHILSDWRLAGERFTRLTCLLPAQLTGAWPTLPALDMAQRQALERAVAVVLGRDFERARDRHASAQRRWLRATQDVERADEECRRIDQAFRAGQCSVLSLARARWQRQRQVESQLHAEADRLVSQHVMDLLARPASALTVV